MDRSPCLLMPIFVWCFFTVRAPCSVAPTPLTEAGRTWNQKWNTAIHSKAAGSCKGRVHTDTAVPAPPQSVASWPAPARLGTRNVRRPASESSGGRAIYNDRRHCRKWGVSFASSKHRTRSRRASWQPRVWSASSCKCIRRMERIRRAWLRWAIRMPCPSPSLCLPPGVRRYIFLST